MVDTEGRERIFMAGWFTHLVLYRVEKLWPHSGAAMRYVTVSTLAVAMLVAVSLLLPARGRMEGANECEGLLATTTARIPASQGKA
jgi:hypothetical protein